MHAFGYSPCHIWLGCKITGVCATCACLFPWRGPSPENGPAQSVFQWWHRFLAVKDGVNPSASFPTFPDIFTITSSNLPRFWRLSEHLHKICKISLIVPFSAYRPLIFNQHCSSYGTASRSLVPYQVAAGHDMVDHRAAGSWLGAACVAPGGVQDISGGSLTSTGTCTGAWGSEQSPPPPRWTPHKAREGWSGSLGG